MVRILEVPAEPLDSSEGLPIAYQMSLESVNVIARNDHEFHKTSPKPNIYKVHLASKHNICQTQLCGKKKKREVIFRDNLTCFDNFDKTLTKFDTCWQQMTNFEHI